nr:mucin-2-like [Lytechinus pictus]
MPRTKSIYREILVEFEKDSTISVLPWKYLKTNPPVKVGDTVTVQYEQQNLRAILLHQSDDPSQIRRFARTAEDRGLAEAPPAKTAEKKTAKKRTVRQPHAQEPSTKKFVAKKAAKVYARAVPRRDLCALDFFPEVSFATDSSVLCSPSVPSLPASPSPPPSPFPSLPPSPASPLPPTTLLSPITPLRHPSISSRQETLLETLIGEIRSLRRVLEERLPLSAESASTSSPSLSPCATSTMSMPPLTSATSTPPWTSAATSTPSASAATSTPPSTSTATSTSPSTSAATSTPPSTSAATSTSPSTSAATSTPPSTSSSPSDTNYLDDKELHFIRMSSCSLGNFAVQVARRIFSRGELQGGNCSGVRGKTALDPQRLHFIFDRVPTVWGVPDSAERFQAVRQCRVAIDTYTRKLK